MVSQKSVEKQLKRLGFNVFGWGRTEVGELKDILLPGEKIFELANGIYEGGFALLVSTDVRVLLIDKKPMKYLTVEDLRFDMINEIDYNHRLIGATVNITTGSRTLKFTSLNQARLRKLITHVQNRMAEIKQTQNSHQEDQKAHLEKINQQLQAYLVAQYQHQLEMDRWQQAVNQGITSAPKPQPVKPSPELSDYLYAQSIMAQYQAMTGADDLPVQEDFLQKAYRGSNIYQPSYSVNSQDSQAMSSLVPEAEISQSPDTRDLAEDARKEIFGKQLAGDAMRSGAKPAPPAAVIPKVAHQARNYLAKPLEINPLRVAYAKLPMAMRNRKFSRPPSAYFNSQAARPRPTVAPAVDQ